MPELLHVASLYLCGHENDIQFIDVQEETFDGNRLPPSLICGTAAKRRETQGGHYSRFNTSEAGFARVDMRQDLCRLHVFQAEEHEPTHIFSTRIADDSLGDT